MSADFHTATPDAAAAHARWSAVDFDDRPTRSDLHDDSSTEWPLPDPDVLCPVCRDSHRCAACSRCSWCNGTGRAYGRVLPLTAAEVALVLASRQQGGAHA